MWYNEWIIKPILYRFKICTLEDNETMEIRGRRVVLVTDTPLPEHTNTALVEMVRQSSVIIVTEGSTRRSLQPKIVAIMGKLLSSADFTEVCGHKHAEFDDHLPDFVIKIGLSWDDDSKKPSITVFQTSRPDYNGGKLVIGHFTLCGLFGDRNDYLKQLRQNPFGIVATLCDKLPQEIGSSLAKLFHTNFLIRNSQLEPIRGRGFSRERAS